MTLRLFPRQSADLHEIQGGEQKTHTFYLAFDRDRVTSMPGMPGMPGCRSTGAARRCSRAPILPGIARQAPCSYSVPIASDPDPDYVALAQTGVDGADTFARKTEKIDEYGWRNFGDLYADHEAVFKADEPAGRLALQQSIRRHRRLRDAASSGRPTRAGGR